MGLVETPVAPSDGEASVGAAGAATIIVKLLVDEKGPAPAAFVALTRQKYCVPFCRPAIGKEVEGIPPWLTTNVEKSEAVDTWSV